ncbi:hypothetical protein Pden_4541 (plasmid) [Paracoccus denitrificans PD1222]|uniref:Uncharacterized protein n=1 Tax=Paracoccus denitrificans (strain Pd 1222) TaxID=318586 RepID=A1BAR0_PARDP|nr:hypothetical protein Pden_4541 [Paracoccus denitrificans PD1222]
MWRGLHPERASASTRITLQKSGEGPLDLVSTRTTVRADQASRSRFYRRYDRMLARWQATQLIRPTPSAVDGYRIGQIDGRTAYTGQVLPANRAIWAETLLIQASIPATAGGHRNCDSGFR